jgi:hypothetical protein
MLAVGIVDIDAAAAPAGIPDQAVCIDHCAIKATDAGVAQQDFGRAAWHPGLRVERYAVQRILGGIGEIADGAID